MFKVSELVSVVSLVLLNETQQLNFYVIFMLLVADNDRLASVRSSYH